MTLLEQLELWVKGESIHNTERDECCPDFSCCRPAVQASPEDREAFYKAFNAADRATMDRMLARFLSVMLVAEGNTVAISEDIIRDSLDD